jgi:hypothetical protein
MTSMKRNIKKTMSNGREERRDENNEKNVSVIT